MDAYKLSLKPYYRPVADEVDIFEAAYSSRLPVMLKGSTGCGKTRFIEYMAWRLQRPLITVSGHDDLTASDLIGRYLLENGGTLWFDGPLTCAVRNGAICYLYEVVEARQDTTVVIRPLTDTRRILPIDKHGEIVTAYLDFQIIISYNPGYQATMKDLKESTKQRFIAIEFTYPDPGVEAEIISREAETSPERGALIASVGKLSRNLREAGFTGGCLHANVDPYSQARGRGHFYCGGDSGRNRSANNGRSRHTFRPHQGHRRGDAMIAETAFKTGSASISTLPAFARLQGMVRQRDALRESFPQLCRIIDFVEEDERDRWAQSILELANVNVGALALIDMFRVTSQIVESGTPLDAAGHIAQEASEICRLAGSAAVRSSLSAGLRIAWTASSADAWRSPGWWSGLVRLAREAPFCIGAVTSLSERILVEVGPAGFSSFIDIGLRLWTGHRERLKAFFTLEDPEARDILDKLGADKTFGACETYLKAFSLSLWGRPIPMDEIRNSN